MTMPLRSKRDATRSVIHYHETFNLEVLREVERSGIFTLAPVIARPPQSSATQGKARFGVKLRTETNDKARWNWEGGHLARLFGPGKETGGFPDHSQWWCTATPPEPWFLPTAPPQGCQNLLCGIAAIPPG